MALESLRRSPRTFKVLVASALVENTAFGLVVPYLTLYMLNDIGISAVLTGIVLMTYTVSGMPSMVLGGMFADRFGRRIVLLSSLGLMSVTMFMYFFAYDFETLVILALVDSFVGSMYMPAANAMIADIIPAPERPRAYSTLRIAWNSGVVLGPLLGFVVVATYSLHMLFVFGALILACAFVLNVLYIRETKPKDHKGDLITFREVLNVSKDRRFFLLCSLSGIFWFFFSQWMSVMPAYASSELGIADYLFGALFAVSALITVLFQLWVTSKAVKFSRSSVLVTGQVIASVGFALIFFASDFYSLLACIVVITVGEIIYMSIIATIIADLAPENKRGLYMGFSGFVQTFGSGIGFLFGMSLLAALSDKSLVWLVFGGIGLASSVGYITLKRMLGPEHDSPRDQHGAGPLER